MKTGGLSRYAEVTSWLSFQGFKIGARVAVHKKGLSYKKFYPEKSEASDNTAHGDYEGRVPLIPGLVYEMSMYELLNFGDCIELNYQLSNCYLDMRVVSRDSNNRVVVEFREIGGMIPTLDVSAQEYKEGILNESVVPRNWAFVEEQPTSTKEIVSNKGYGTRIEIG